MSYQPRNCLITGGAGFIGSHFVRHMLAQYPDVKLLNLDALTYAGSTENLPDDPRHIFIKGNIGNADLVQKLLREHEIDTIVHFAAESHVDRSITGPADFIQTNIVGTFTLLNAAKQYWLDEKKWGETQCRFHHISTDEVYGSLDKTAPAFTELNRYEPNSPYSASKAGSDHLVRAYFHTYGLPVTTSNCSNNYGPYQHTEKLIPTVIQACVNEQPIPVYGDGSNIRDWLYVGDHCEAIDTIIQKGTLGEVYNIGGHCELSNLALIHQLCDVMEAERQPATSYRQLISFVTDRAGHDWRYAIDSQKLEESLGWTPKTTLKSGLQETVSYYLTTKMLAKSG